MIYTFGSSLTKYYWPTWADWLQVYKGPVTNWGYNGYDVTKVYWTLVDKLKYLSKDDEVYIMWPGNTTLSVWYDDEWIKKNQCRDFFPNRHGDLWYTTHIKWQGLYKQHPEHQPSFIHLLINNLQCIINAQLLLDKIGCKYTMLFNLNPWVDIRPEYGNQYKTVWDSILNINEDILQPAYTALDISPVQTLINMMNLDNYIGVPADPSKLCNYQGIWEYDISNKEYVVLKNPKDMHPTAVSHHDYLLEKILKVDPLSGMHRQLALAISKQCTTMNLPAWQTEDYTATPDTESMILEFKNQLIATQIK